MDEAHKLVQRLLTNDAIIMETTTTDTTTEEMNKQVNGAFAQVIHALLERYNRSDNERHSSNINNSFLKTAEALEKQMLNLYDQKPLALQPNTTSMNARIALLGAKKKVADALALLHTMIDAQDNASGTTTTTMAPNRVTFNSCIHACAQAGNHEEARDTLRLLMSRHKQQLSTVTPDVLSFNTLLNAYSNSGRPDAGRNAERILDWMEQLSSSSQEGEGLNHNLSPDVYSYTAVIDAYSKSKSPDRAEAVLSRLLQRQKEGYNVAPTVVTFTAVLHAISRRSGNSTDRAVAVIDLMEELHSSGVVDVAPTTATYNALLNVWKRSRNHPDAATQVLKILEEMKLKPEFARPNSRTYNIVLSTLSSTNNKGANNNNIDVAEDLVREMSDSKDPNVRPNSITYNSLLNILANSKTMAANYRAQEIFSMMKENEGDDGNYNTRAAPIPETYNVMMKIAANNNNTGGIGSSSAGAYHAEELLDELEGLYTNGDLRLRPTTVSYTTCITAWSRADDDLKIVRAHKLMDRMKAAYAAGNRNAQPNTVAYNSLLSCYKNVVCGVRGGVGFDDQIGIIPALWRLLDEMRESDYCRPNQITYLTIMKTLGSLPRQDQRLHANMKRVFDLCREDREVGEQMIRFLKHVSPDLLV